jgi:GTPase SAR1 family protein
MDNVGALIVYDITDVDSFAKVDIWVNELQKYLLPGTPIMIAGNKADKQERYITLK